MSTMSMMQSEAIREELFNHHKPGLKAAQKIFASINSQAHLNVEFSVEDQTSLHCTLQCRSRDWYRGGGSPAEIIYEEYYYIIGMDGKFTRSGYDLAAAGSMKECWNDILRLFVCNSVNALLLHHWDYDTP